MSLWNKIWTPIPKSVSPIFWIVMGILSAGVMKALIERRYSDAIAFAALVLLGVVSLQVGLKLGKHLDG